MKSITIHIDEETFIKLKKCASLLSFMEGCVSPPSILEQVMHTAICKMDQGDTEMTVTNKKAP